MIALQRFHVVIHFLNRCGLKTDPVAVPQRRGASESSHPSVAKASGDIRALLSYARRHYSALLPSPTARIALRRTTLAPSRIAGFAALAGVSRMAETTQLDRLRIPTAYCIRPYAASASAIVSSGKGLTRISARHSAVFEAVERAGAETTQLGCVLTHHAEAMSPFPFAGLELQTDNAVNAWTPGINLRNGKVSLVPVNAVVYPPVDRKASTESSTRGLAAGLSFAESVIHGLFELVEADALRKFDSTKWERIDLRTSSKKVRRMAGRFQSEAIEIAVFRGGARHGIPAVFSVGRDTQLSVRLLCFGIGAGLSEEEALLKSLLEVAQSRAGVISGLRDDLSRQYAHQDQSDPLRFNRLFEAVPSKGADAGHSPASISLRELLARVQMALSDVGAIFAVSLSSPPGAFVSRVLRLKNSF